MILSISFINKTCAKSKTFVPAIMQVASLKYFPPPQEYPDIEMPEKPKLPVVPRVPVYPPQVRPPKMIKNLRFMRGPEVIHNSLIHKQYGIVALTGGRLRIGHFEMIRLTLGRKIDPQRMFLTWRIDPPWQPVTKKSQGHRMGGGKGAIDHYVTPIKAHRVIVELAGKCTFNEVKGFLTNVANILPFKAIAVSHEMLEKQAAKEERDKKRNLNPFTAEYVIKNNMSNCHQIINRPDLFHFLKYP